MERRRISNEKRVQISNSVYVMASELSSVFRKHNDFESSAVTNYNSTIDSGFTKVFGRTEIT